MIGNDWDEILKEEYNKTYFKNLISFVEEEYKKEVIYPYYSHIYNALKLTTYKDTKVVILGQDPYFNVGEAHGLCFSVPKGIKVPPSLRNIYKELYNDLGIEPRKDGDLESWSKQGVLLLNAVLTVRKELPASHRNKGWEIFTDEIIKKLNEKKDPVVFILWGSYARSKKEYITNKQHYIIESVHPSPLAASRGFFGSKPFSKTNKFLKDNGLKEINWEIKETI